MGSNCVSICQSVSCPAELSGPEKVMPLPDLLPKNWTIQNWNFPFMMPFGRKESSMKRSKFTEAQIAFILRQAEEGTAVAEVCRKAGISDATFYNWRKKYAGLMPSEMKKTID